MGTCQPHICDVGVYVPQGEEILTFCTWEKSVSSEEDTPKLPRHPSFLPSYISLMSVKLFADVRWVPIILTAFSFQLHRTQILHRICIC